MLENKIASNYICFIISGTQQFISVDFCSDAYGYNRLRNSDLLVMKIYSNFGKIPAQNLVTLGGGSKPIKIGKKVS